MALIYLFCLIIIWAGVAKLNDDIALTGLLAPVLSLIAAVLYGSFIWLKTGQWGLIDVSSVFSFFNNQALNLYSFASYIGFSKLNTWYLGTNIAWSTAFIPPLGNIFCTFVFDGVVLKRSGSLR